jgi:hypothetical protein
MLPWDGTNMKVAGNCSLVKSVFTSEATYRLTSLGIQSGVLHVINKVSRPFVWVGAETASGGKCNIKWEVVF